MKRREEEDFGRALGELVKTISDRDKKVYAIAYAAGLERAAEIADEHTGQAMVGPASDPGCFTASLIAAAIRAEKEADHG